MGELPKESKEGNAHTADFEGKTIDVFKLIDLAKGIITQKVEVDLLKKALDGNYWYDEHGEWLSPGKIIEQMEASGSLDEVAKKHPEWKEEIENIKRADYKEHPIILIGDTVVDGMHRLTKAVIDDAKEIDAKRFDNLPEETIIK